MVTIPEWIAKTEGLLTAVIQESVQSVAIDASVPWFKGGKMRVVTGFLRNSEAAEIGSLPAGESKRPEDYANSDFDPSAIILVINQMKLGDTIYIGWTAEYARFMENRYGFMRSAAQKWPEFVNEAVSLVSKLK